MALTNEVSIVLDALKRDHIFLTGSAGVGKSFTVHQVIATLKQEAKRIIALGSTGISAVALGGMTLHSFFGFGISDNLEALQALDRKNHSKLKELYEILRQSDLIVIDEISMVSASMMDMIYYRLLQSGFSGKLLLIGDFYQLPPVRKGSALYEELYAFESSAWRALGLRTIELTQVKRTKDKHFIAILDAVRRGELSNEILAYLQSLQAQHIEPKRATTLFGRNVEASRLNKEILTTLKVEQHLFYAEIETLKKIDERRIERWVASLPIEKVLSLKEAAAVLFTTNKWGNYLNGERGVVKSIEEDHIVIEKGDRFVRVEPHTFVLQEPVIKEDKLTYESIATCTQYPLKLAYAITIHKSQGMSIDDLVCNVDRIFAPSQFYVAISRATDPKRLSLASKSKDLRGYLSRIIHVDERVKRFYERVEALQV